MEKKLLFVYNPYSGKAQMRDYLSDIIDIFVKGGYAVTVHPTQQSLDGYSYIKEHAEEYDLVACSGGDGTLNEAVRGLMACENPPHVGYIPTGTTNDFATSLGLSKDMLEAAETIVSGEDFSCDIGSFNHNNFTYISAFGAFTDVAYETSQQRKNMLGHLAYVLEGAKRLGSIQSYRMTVEHDGETFEDEYIFGMVSNSMSVGGIIRNLGEMGVKLDDGLFEVGLIKMPNNMTELNQTLSDIMRRDLNSPYIRMFRTSEIRFSSAVPVPWTLDGEFGGNKKDVLIKNKNKALTFIRNKAEATEE